MSEIHPLPGDHANQASKQTYPTQLDPPCPALPGKQETQGPGDEQCASDMTAWEAVPHDERWQHARSGALKTSFQQLAEEHPNNDRECSVLSFGPLPANAQPTKGKNAQSDKDDHRPIGQERIVIIERAGAVSFNPVRASSIERPERGEKEELKQNQAEEEQGEVLRAVIRQRL